MIQDMYNTLTAVQEAATVRSVVPEQHLYRRYIDMKPLDLLAGALLIVGGLNWGLVALAEFDLVAWVFGEDFGTTNAASRLVYGLVGLSAVYAIASVLSRRTRSTSTRRPRTRTNQ